MFPLQSDGFPLEAIPPLISDHYHQEKMVGEILATKCAHFEGNETKNETETRKRRRRVMNFDREKPVEEANREDRRSLHRDVERQRRREMAGFYSSLRSLLPLEFIKGKRAVSDQLHQAASYISHMQEKIEKLKTERDKLKMWRAEGQITELAGSESSTSVKVNPWLFGVEILIRSIGHKEEPYPWPLSKLFAYLLGKPEFTVISCVSTRAGDESTLHKIQIEVNDPTSIDLSELQERLINEIFN